MEKILEALHAVDPKCGVYINSAELTATLRKKYPERNILHVSSVTYTDLTPHSSHDHTGMDISLDQTQ